MIEFTPFEGWRYNPERVSLSQVLAPPYDVLTREARDRLAHQSPFNEVIIETPEPDFATIQSRAQTSAAVLSQWIDANIIVPDNKRAFYPYRMTNPSGATIDGVIGTLSINQGVRPHEATAERVVSDRFDLLRETRFNLSPIWGVIPEKTLKEWQHSENSPLIDVVDDHGVRHQLWIETDELQTSELTALLSNNSVVVVDGHHRFEAARRYSAGIHAGHRGAHKVLALLCEASTFPSAIPSVHRLLTGADASRVERYLTMRWKKVAHSDHAPSHPSDPRRIIIGDQSGWTTYQLMSEDPQVVALEEVATIIDSLAGVRVTLFPTPDRVKRGASTINRCGVLVPDISLEAIRQRAHLGMRLPIKSTFFTPKPISGMVFRRLND